MDDGKESGVHAQVGARARACVCVKHDVSAPVCLSVCLRLYVYGCMSLVPDSPGLDHRTEQAFREQYVETAQVALVSLEYIPDAIWAVDGHGARYGVHRSLCSSLVHRLSYCVSSCASSSATTDPLHLLFLIFTHRRRRRRRRYVVVGEASTHGEGQHRSGAESRVDVRKHTGDTHHGGSI